jgi:hypothetical protein
MTTDIAVLERALVVVAISQGIQTLLFLGVAVAAFIAWRRASEALVRAKDLAEQQVSELRGHLERMSATVDETAKAVRHGTETVDEVITDMRQAVGTVTQSVGTVATAVNAQRAALAIGVWRGVQYWRKRRAAQQRLADAATSEM